MRLKAIVCGRRKWASLVKVAFVSLVLLLFYQWYTLTRNTSSQLDTELKFDGGKELGDREEKKDEIKVVESTDTPKCGNQKACEKTETSFHLKSGYSTTVFPSVCLDDKYIIGADGGHPPSRGMDIAVLEESSQAVVKAETFDLYQYDSTQLTAFLKSVKDRQIILVVTFDDAANQLSGEARKIFSDDFGSALIEQLNYRGNWVFIGQKGVLDSPYHHEEIHLFDKAEGEWPKQIEIEGCVPLLKAVEPKAGEALQSSTQCGLPEVCTVSSIAVAVHSGYVENNKKILPSVCINGDIVMGDKVKTPNRGINIVIFNPASKKVEKTATYDTYESMAESDKMAQMIKSVSAGHLVIAATHDEASHQLGYEGKGAFMGVGSGELHQLDYRSSWVFIGQQGLHGLSPYEKMADREDLGWGPKVEIKECIPQIIKPLEGLKVVPNNRKREQFCKEYEGYGDFCSEENIKKLLQPLPLDNESLKDNPVFSIPIVVVPGVDLNALRKTFDSLLTVPGLNPQMVMVGNDGDFTEPVSLTELYGFRSEKLQVTTKYQYHMHKAIASAFVRYPHSQYAIVLEEQLEVTPDFLNYFAQTLPLMDKDKSIISISAWNSNGFTSTSGDTGLLYRTENFPGLGWVVSRSNWNEMKTKLGECCDSRVWYDWLSGESRKGREMVVPDVSRVTRFEKDTLSPDQDFISVYFANRKSVSGGNIQLRDVDHLVKDEYEKEIYKLLEESVTLDASYTDSCLQGKVEKFGKLDGEGEIYSIFYEEEQAESQDLLKRLCKCFGLFSMANHEVKGLHNGMLRFQYLGNHVMLIGSRSPYYNRKSSDVKAIQIINPVME